MNVTTRARAPWLAAWGRSGRVRIGVLIVALVAACLQQVLASANARAVNSFDNGAIADQGLALVGQSGGQCKQFANDMVYAASGGHTHLGGGYYTDYQNAGGVMVSRDDAVKGDIIQLNGSNVDTYYTGMHTAIIVSYQGSNVFDVVDSNFGSPVNNQIVHHHTWNPYTTAKSYGLSVNIWRLGSVNMASNPTPTTPDDPKVNIESATQVAAGVRLVGWAYDPNTTNAVEIDVYEGTCCGAGRGAYMATVSRPDFGLAYPAWGSNHGYDITLSLATGQWTSKTYCLYFINQGAGGNTSACKTVTTNWNPIGNTEVARRAPGGVHLQGWALDFDTTNALETDVYEGTCCAAAIGAFTANSSRPDVGAAFPGSGNNHGFEVAIGAAPPSTTTKTYCAYAINQGNGNSSPLVGCQSVTVSPDAVGNYESVTAVSGGARIVGWTLDQDTSASTVVDVYDGACCTNPVGEFNANASRPDVASVWTDYGDLHGFDVTVSLSAGTHNICVFGINAAGTYGNNADLGCRSVTVT